MAPNDSNHVTDQDGLVSVISPDGRLLRTIAAPPSAESVVTLDGSGVRYRLTPATDVSGVAERAEASSGHDRTAVMVAEAMFDDDPESTFTRVPSTDGVQVALHHFGGDGPPLVICHATGFNAAAYAPLAVDLGVSFDVWAIDMRGHGDTNAPASEDFSWAGMAQDLLAAVEAIGRGPVAAVGHSMGGAAIVLAELAQPGTISGAYLYEPIIFPEAFLTDERRQNPMSGAARSRREVFASRQAAYDRYGSRMPLQLLRPDALAGYVQHGFANLSDQDAAAADAEPGSVRLACRAEHEAQTFECPTKVTIEQVTGLGLPTTVAAGTAKDGAPADIAPAIADAMPARFLTYDGLGHFGPLQDPTRIGADVIAALVSG